MKKTIHTYAGTINHQGQFLVGAKSKTQARKILQRKMALKGDVARISYRVSNDNGRVPMGSGYINVKYKEVVMVF